MGSIERATVSVVQELRLVGPDRLIVPLAAEWYYSRQDPYAVRMSFDTGTGEPVVWAFGRDLLAAALHAPDGMGDVQAWPSTESADAAGDGVGFGEKILNIVLGPPDGYARFETYALGIEAFLARTYELVPSGQEPGCLHIDAELNELLSQA